MAAHFDTAHIGLWDYLGGSGVLTELLILLTHLDHYITGISLFCFPFVSLNVDKKGKRFAFLKVELNVLSLCCVLPVCLHLTEEENLNLKW